MVIQQTDNYIKACMKTWMFCESCIHSETEKRIPKEALIQKCRSCANSCFAVVCGIINNSDIINDAALTCILNCRECQQECEKFDYNDDIQFCGEVCEFCAQTMRDLLVLVNLN